MCTGKTTKLSKLWLVCILAAMPAFLSLGLNAQSEESDDENIEEIETFSVTGTLIRRTDAVGPAPILTLDSEDIETSGYQQVSDLLRQLPMNTGFSEADATASFAADGAYVNLRGIGPQGTLVLVNGRRLAPYGAADFNGRNFADLNSIPASAIAKIEVLKTGASAVYGSDALGGAINIILKKDFEGVEFGVYYGNSTSDEDYGVYNMTATVGTSSERGSLIAIANYYNRKPFFLRDRDYSAYGNQGEAYNGSATLANDGYFAFDKTSGTRDQGVDGGGFYLSSAHPMGRFDALRASELTLPDGTVTANNTHFRGYWFPGSGSQSDINNWEYYNYNDDISAISKAIRKGIILMGDYDITDTIEFFVEANVQSNYSYTVFAPAPSFGDFTIPATNPYNPTNPNNGAYYNPDVYTNIGADPASYPDGLDLYAGGWRPKGPGNRDFETTSDFFRFVGGFKVALEEIDWEIETSFMFTKSKLEDTTRNLMVADLVQGALNNTETSATNADPSTWALNPFGFLPGGDNVEVWPLITTDDTRYADSELELWSVVGSGPLFDLPAGTLDAAVGVEFRRQRLEDRPSLASQQGQLIGSGGTSSSGNREASAVFAEIRLPILESLEAQLAARYEDYDDFGDTGVKPQIGLLYRATEWMSLRVAYAENFRAPSLAQAYAGVQRGFSNLEDQIRFPITNFQFDGSGQQKEVRTGGNPILQPEESTSTSIGLIYSGQGALEGLEVSVDFWNIDASNLISTQSDNQTLADEADLFDQNPSAFLAMDPTTRGRMTNVYREANEDFGGQTIPGQILYIDSTYQNLDTVEVRGLDLELVYTLATDNMGTFTFGTFWTYYDKYKDGGEPNENEVGTFRLPEYRGNFSTTWDYGDVRLSLLANYVSEYDDIADDSDGVPYTIESFLTWDLRATYRGFWDTEITVGLDNVLGEEPPYYRGDNSGYDPAFSDPVERFAWISLSKAF
jgi:iron complex outermembrane receptor protein